VGCYSVKNDRIYVNVKVGTGMRENRICGVKNDELVVQIKARAEKDKANRELLKYLSKLLGISRADVDIRTGAHSRHKVISLPESAASLVDSIAGH
jgi:uncharacterized protein (TIGR00251 family)